MALFGDLGGTPYLHLEQSSPPSVVPAGEGILNPKLLQALAPPIRGYPSFQRSPHLATEVDRQSHLPRTLIPFGKLSETGSGGFRCQHPESTAPQVTGKGAVTPSNSSPKSQQRSAGPRRLGGAGLESSMLVADFLPAIPCLLVDGRGGVGERGLSFLLPLSHLELGWGVDGVRSLVPRHSLVTWQFL